MQPRTDTPMWRRTFKRQTLPGSTVVGPAVDYRCLTVQIVLNYHVVHVGFVVDTIVMVQFSLSQLFGFPLSASCHLRFVPIHSSYHRGCTILTEVSVVKMVIILATQVRNPYNHPRNISEHWNADRSPALAQRNVWGTVIGCCQIEWSRDSLWDSVNCVYIRM